MILWYQSLNWFRQDLGVGIETDTHHLVSPVPDRRPTHSCYNLFLPRPFGHGKMTKFKANITLTCSVQCVALKAVLIIYDDDLVIFFPPSPFSTNIPPDLLFLSVPNNADTIHVRAHVMHSFHENETSLRP